MYHVSLCEIINDACRSKKLREIFGLCISYNELERIDMALAERVIPAAESHLTSVPPIIEAYLLLFIMS